MASKLTLTLFLVIVGLTYTSALYQPTTRCPAVQISNSHRCGTDTCETNEDCLPDRWCCPNACGGNTCSVVTASCTASDGEEFAHHAIMEFVKDYETDRCGFCYCQNGSKNCHIKSCSGPM